MELYQLKVFAEVVRQKGFSAAATVLHSTQPTVSRIIGQLEDDLGHRLLLRDNREVTLTPAGKVVHRRALALLTEAARLRSDLDDLSHMRHGEITLGVPPLGNMLLLPLVKAFRHRYPGIELHLLDGGTLTLEDALLAGRAELATLLSPVNIDRFESIPVIHDRLVVVVPKKSPLARRRFLRLADLKAEAFILFPPGYVLNSRIVAACQAAGFQPRIAGHNGQWQFILAMVGSGLGLTLLPESALAGESALAMIPAARPGHPVGIAPGLAAQRAPLLSRASRSSTWPGQCCPSTRIARASAPAAPDPAPFARSPSLHPFRNRMDTIRNIHFSDAVGGNSV
ncbi:MAG: LysR family transcriptional regulator [Verrucomicrobiota bacterium]